MQDKQDAAHDINEPLQPADVPVFSCIVYLSRAEDGRVQARVANLSGFQCTASSEREALMQLVPAFKQRVRELTQEGTAVPWIDPPPAPKPGEQERFVPVHL